MFDIIVDGKEENKEDMVKENDIMRELANKWGIKVSKEKKNE